jgi:hypothetical protein
MIRKVENQEVAIGTTKTIQHENNVPGVQKMGRENWYSPAAS